MSDVVESKQVGPLTVEVVVDDEPAINPREDYTQIGTMALEHRRYILGDDTDEAKMAKDALDRAAAVVVARWLKIFHGATVVLPVYGYEHGALALQASSFDTGNPFYCPWDSGFAGIIFDTQASREETGVPLDKVEEALRHEVEEYNSWLNGEVYGYLVRDEEGGVLGSCWGFIGDSDYAMEAGVEEAESLAESYQQPVGLGWPTK